MPEYTQQESHQIDRIPNLPQVSPGMMWSKPSVRSASATAQTRQSSPEFSRVPASNSDARRRESPAYLGLPKLLNQGETWTPSQSLQEGRYPMVGGDMKQWASPPKPTDTVNRNADSLELTIEQLRQRIASERLWGAVPARKVDLPYVLSLALQHSRNIQVQRIQPAEALQEVNQEFGQFDWRGFLESLFSQDSRAITVFGQTNRTIDQVRNDAHGVAVGLRKQTYSGGEFQISERLGVTDSNSGLLNPDQPGDAQVAITFSQEVLRDGGRDVVLSRALLASLRADIAHADAYANVSDLLQAVLAQYWDLYQKRGNYLIQRSLIQWAEETLRLLESRGKLDAEQNSIEQARALLEEGRANLERAHAAVLISQDQLYRLVNAPELDSNTVEILTVQPPQATAENFDVGLELHTALQSRAEIKAKLIEIRSAAINHNVSLNQLLPRLTLFVESSLNGVDANLDFWSAQQNMFDVDPSYAAGVNMEIFFANRSAKAQNKRAKLVMQRLQLEYEDLVQLIRFEVAAAIRTLNASNKILEQRRLTLEARQKEIEALRRRREVVAQQGVSPSLLLEQFFQAINRLVISQQAYVAAQRDQQAALAELLRAKGVLLNVQEIPRDINRAVPTPLRALYDRSNARDGIDREVYRRVIEPGLTQPLPAYR
ncbi:MAG: TolC family protein [Planctomycetota bacterium]